MSGILQNFSWNQHPQHHLCTVWAEKKLAFIIPTEEKDSTDYQAEEGPWLDMDLEEDPVGWIGGCPARLRRNPSWEWTWRRTLWDWWLSSQAEEGSWLGMDMEEDLSGLVTLMPS